LTPVEETLQDLEAHLDAGRPDAAIGGAWQLFDLAPDNQRVKLLLLDILSKHSDLVTPDNKSALQKLLNDPAIDPREVAWTGWRVLRQKDSAIPGSSPEATARWLEADEFAQHLLQQTYVTDLEIEIALTAMRRWLLLSGRWPEFPRTTEALVEQAAQNGGTWLFDSEERACLDADPSARIAQAFRPQRPERRRPVGFLNQPPMLWPSNTRAGLIHTGRALPGRCPQLLRLPSRNTTQTDPTQFPPNPLFWSRVAALGPIRRIGL
jgi:hypothetical protein